MSSVDKIIVFIKEVGFPIAVTTYLIVRFDEFMREIIAGMVKISITQDATVKLLTELIQKLDK